MTYIAGRVPNIEITCVTGFYAIQAVLKELNTDSGRYTCTAREQVIGTLALFVSAVELVATDIEEGGGLGLVALAPFQGDIKHPAGDCIHGDQVGGDREVIGNDAAGRQFGSGIRPGAAGNPAGADAEVLGLD